MDRKSIVFWAVVFECAAAFAAEPWEDPAVNSINRLPARTYAMPLASERDALTDDLEPKTPYKLSLNGTWRISWAGDPALRVKDFYRLDYQDDDWCTIDVPSCVETRGFGSPGYTNQEYPHANAWPKILDRDSDTPDYNPVSSYRTRFTVPKAWAGRDVILRFDGVYSAYYVWVNGKKVGYAEDSKLPSEFNITPFLDPQPSATNLLAVEVYRWCDGSYLEDQDMFRFSGIFRDVTLWAKPKDGIWDFEVKASVDGRLEVEVGVNDQVEKVGGGGERIVCSLYDAAFKKVGELQPLSTSTSASTYFLHLDKPRLWSAEDPYLYTLVIRKGDDIRMKRIGFKEQKIVGHTFLVNGKPVKFKGVNRHEVSPENGRTVSLDEMTRDVTLMKQYNVNTVRTSHYPDHHLWYDLCDRYGIYLVAEANVEGHEPGYGEKGLGRFPEWEPSVKERNLRHVTCYRDHPSVTMWSMGNETGHGDVFRHAIAAVRALDPSRPIHWERGNVDADIDSHMYPSVEWLEERGKFGDGPRGVPPPQSMNDAPDTRQTAGKCHFVCEYAHAMGNALGNFQEYWDVFYAHESLAGGCIWDWIDQGLWKYTDRVDPKTGKRERFLAYGGDYDEQPNSGPFCCNGVIDPLRRVSAKLVEVGQVHRNLVVTKRADGTLELWNRFSFTPSDAFDGRWRLLADGREVATGSFDVPKVAPLSRGTIDPKTFLDAKTLENNRGRELLLEVDFLLRADACWAKRGWPVARNQVALEGAWNFAKDAPAACGKVAVEPTERGVRVRAGGTKALFDSRTGTLAELVMDGCVILRDAAEGLPAGPRLTCMRAFVDNDRWIRDDVWFGKTNGNFTTKGLTQLNYHPHRLVTGDNFVRVVTDVTGRKSGGFVHEATWTFAEDGSVSVSNRVTPVGSMPIALPRLGLSLVLDRALERVEWYGRGPRENYIDRLTGSFLGIYDATVTDLYEPYVRPQDNGYRSDVRWVTFRDGQGRGVRFSASEPLFVQALHYSVEDLEKARHRKRQERLRTPLVAREETCLNLDVRQLGLGGASCGPVPMAKYTFPIEPVSWTLRLSPVRASAGAPAKTPSAAPAKTLPRTDVPLNTNAAEVVRFFAANVYGERPDLSGFVKKCSVADRGVDPALKARRREITLNTMTPWGETNFTALAFEPEHAAGTRVPCFVYLSFKKPTEMVARPEDASLQPWRWPVKDILSRGYATVSFYYEDVFPDRSNAIKVWGSSAERPADGWGAISAWALAASRVMDCLETMDGIDAAKIAVVGHSRLGKTALWTGATDKRFAYAVVNDSGCMGARMSTRNLPGCETIDIISGRFPHWFAPTFRRQFVRRDTELPFDQHWLVAALAPRLVAVGSAEDDYWACPSGEHASLESARPAWGERGNRCHYHIRPGGHDITPVDWADYMDFAKKHGW